MRGIYLLGGGGGGGACYILNLFQHFNLLDCKKLQSFTKAPIYVGNSCTLIQFSSLSSGFNTAR